LGLIIRLIALVGGSIAGKTFYFGGDFRPSRLCQLHYERQVLARAARGGFVSLLTKDHVLGCEPPEFDEELASGRTLKASIEQASFTQPAPLGHTGWRPDISLATIALSTVISVSAFLGSQVETFVFHLTLHSGVRFSPIGWLG